MKNKKITCIIIVCCIFIFLGCNKSETTDLCENYIAAVVEIQVRDDNEQIVGNATGTFISRDGKILTNRHVIRKYNFATQEYDYFSNIYIRFYNKETFEKASLICYSSESDLALLQATAQVETFFNIGNGQLKMGQQVHTIGNGNGFGLAYSSGFIASPLKKVKYEDKYVEAIQLDLVINEGNSGGALFDNEGKLIGITTFRLRDGQNNIIYGSCFALPINAIQLFLDNSKNKDC